MSGRVSCDANTLSRVGVVCTDYVAIISIVTCFARKFVEMSSETPIDPIRFEVIRNSLVEATEEMASALRRSAYSTNIKTRHDFSCAIFDRKMRIVAQSFSQPNHLGSLMETIPRALETYGLENLSEGDGILVNLPYTGGVHLNDITLISPVYLDSTPVGFVASLAHHVDVGGGAPASIGAFREVYQEGIIIPPVKFVDGGDFNRDVFDLVLAQVRAKRETAGDFPRPNSGEQHRNSQIQGSDRQDGCGRGGKLHRRVD